MSNQEKKIERFLRERWRDATFLAEGGNSWVYKATDTGQTEAGAATSTTNAGGQIAIKVLRRTDRYPRFDEEVRAAEDLKAIPGIVKVLQHQLHGKASLDSLQQLAYFTMPLLEGSLERRLVPSLDNDGSEAVRAIMRVCEIISEIHTLRFAHRDLKPDNVLVAASGELFVSDYGLCIDLESNRKRHTQTEEIVGAILYRAPEYLRGRLDASDHRPGDVFSIGRMLWALLLGRHPSGLTDYEFSRHQVSTELLNLRRPGLIDQLIGDCTKVVPSERPNIKLVLEALREWSIQRTATDIRTFIERIDTSPASRAEDERHKAARARDVLIESAIAAARRALETHELTIELRTNRRRPDQPEISSSEGWITDVAAATTLKQSVGGTLFRFNIGNLESAPLVSVQCGFYDYGDRVGFEIVASAIHHGEPQPRHWGPALLQFGTFDAIVHAQIERHVNDAMIFVSAELTESARRRQ